MIAIESKVLILVRAYQQQFPKFLFAINATNLLVSAIDGSLTNKPVNTAITLGIQTQLNCSSNSINSVYWQFKAIGSTSQPTVIYTKFAFVSNYNKSYSIASDAIDTGQFNLVIKNASSTTCGYYICIDGADSTSAAADVVVIGRFVHCYRLNLSTNVI